MTDIQYTDTHCHLASHRFRRDEIAELIRRANDAGVTRLVTLSTSLEDVPVNLALAGLPGVHACVGIHPCDVHHAPDDAVARLAGFCADPRVCAIGETGLDYYHPAPDGWEESVFRERQRTMLRQHFELAAATGLNVVIHTRDQTGHASFEDALAIYREFHTVAKAVFHCFVGPWENAARVIGLGGVLSFGGVCTFKSAREVRETIRRCPAGTFMLETDAPYLAPEPHRGQRNEPAHTSITAMRIAAERGESPAELATHTQTTAECFFRFPSGRI
jgi:TatD DNase family protein